MDLEEVVGELYGLDASEFVAARDGRARAARQSGDRGLADQVKALKRPAVAAWVVNNLVRQRPGEIERLVRFGESFRDAQASLAGDELRRLGRQRHQVLGALGQEARRLAEERGQPVSPAVERDVESTLDTAVTDPGAADAVRSGRLLRALSHAGMGPVDLSGAVAAPEVAVAPLPAPASAASAGSAREPAGSAPRPSPEDDKIAAARDALEDAEADVERADHRVSVAERGAQEAVDRREEAERRVRAPEDELARARPQGARGGPQGARSRAPPGRPGAGPPRSPREHRPTRGTRPERRARPPPDLNAAGTVGAGRGARSRRVDTSETQRSRCRFGPRGPGSPFLSRLSSRSQSTRRNLTLTRSYPGAKLASV